MKNFIRICAAVLAMMLLAGCVYTDDPLVVTEVIKDTTPDPVLQERRDTAESYMRDMATVLWRATEDITWTTDSTLEDEEDLAAYMEKKDPMIVRAGRLYQGIPYSYAGQPLVTFNQFFGENDKTGAAQVSGITWKHLNGSATKAVSRVGNDCSGAVQLAWEYIGGNFTPVSTAHMTLSNGFLPVGTYEADPLEYVDTTKDCEKNGGEVMFAAYAQLQKADAVVCRQDGAGHTMMVTSVHVEYMEDGSIDGMNSYITVLHQTSSNLKKEAYTYNEALGENVYMTYGVDDKYTFLNLLGSGYLPVTCDALVNPDAQREDIWHKDSEAVYSFDNILKGSFSSNYLIAFVTVTITDSTGAQVMAGTCLNPRQTTRSTFDFDMTAFETEPEFLLLGNLNLQALTPGDYHCTHVLTDAHGNEYTMRDFDFTVD